MADMHIALIIFSAGMHHLTIKLHLRKHKFKDEIIENFKTMTAEYQRKHGSF